MYWFDLIYMLRALMCEERGYKVRLSKILPLSCSPKHNLIIGAAPARPNNKTTCDLLAAR
jgi:hypothetical protein